MFSMFNSMIPSRAGIEEFWAELPTCAEFVADTASKIADTASKISDTTSKIADLTEKAAKYYSPMEVSIADYIPETETEKSTEEVASKVIIDPFADDGFESDNPFGQVPGKLSVAGSDANPREIEEKEEEVADLTEKAAKDYSPMEVSIANNIPETESEMSTEKVASKAIAPFAEDGFESDNPFGQVPGELSVAGSDANPREVEEKEEEVAIDVHDVVSKAAEDSAVKGFAKRKRPYRPGIRLRIRKMTPGQKIDTATMERIINLTIVNVNL